MSLASRDCLARSNSAEGEDILLIRDNFRKNAATVFMCAARPLNFGMMMTEAENSGSIGMNGTLWLFPRKYPGQLVRKAGYPMLYNMEFRFVHFPAFPILEVFRRFK